MLSNTKNVTGNVYKLRRAITEGEWGLEGWRLEGPLSVLELSRKTKDMDCWWMQKENARLNEQESVRGRKLLSLYKFLGKRRNPTNFGRNPKTDNARLRV